MTRTVGFALGIDTAPAKAGRDAWAGYTQDVGRAATQMGKAVDAAQGTVDRAAGRFIDAQGRMRDANGRFVAGVVAAGRAMQTAGRDADVWGQRSHAAADRASEAVTRFARDADRSLTFVKRTLGGLSVAALAREVVQMADASTEMTSRLRIVTTDTQALAEAQQDVYRIAQETGSSLGAVGDLYTKLSRSGRELGATQQEIATVTEGVAKALAVSGATAMESESAIRQLAQALGSGTLSGDELRAILEAAPVLASELAKTLGTTVAGLRKMGAEGELTSQRVFDALVTASKNFDAQFAQMDGTVGRSVTRVGNAMLRLVGIQDGATGASQRLAGALDDVARLIDESGPLLRGLGEAAVVTLTLGGAVWGLTKAYGAATVAMGAFNVGLLASPLAPVVLAIGALSAALGVSAYNAEVARDEFEKFTNSLRRMPNTEKYTALRRAEFQISADRTQLNAGGLSAGQVRELQERIRKNLELVKALEAVGAATGNIVKVEAQRTAGAAPLSKQETERIQKSRETVAALAQEVAWQDRLFEAASRGGEAYRVTVRAIEREKAVLEAAQNVHASHRAEVAALAATLHDATKATEELVAAQSRLGVKTLWGGGWMPVAPVKELSPALVQRIERGSQGSQARFKRMVEQVTEEQARMEQIRGNALRGLQESVGGAVREGLLNGFADAEQLWRAFAQIGTSILAETVAAGLAKALRHEKTRNDISAGVAGLGVGYSVGQQLGDRVGGVAGGAGAGAAVGLAVAGPLGAVIGGLAGAAGGFLGASRAQEEAARRLAAATVVWERGIADFREMARYGAANALAASFRQNAATTNELASTLAERYGINVTGDATGMLTWAEGRRTEYAEAGMDTLVERFDRFIGELRDLLATSREAQGRLALDSAEALGSWFLSQRVAQVEASGGDTTEVSQLARRAAYEEELAATLRRFDPAVHDAVRAMAELTFATREAAIARAREREIADTQQDVFFTFGARRAALNGDERGARRQEALDGARQEGERWAAMFEQGLISFEQLAEILAVINGELDKTFTEIDQQIQDAKNAEAERRRSAVEDFGLRLQERRAVRSGDPYALAEAQVARATVETARELGEVKKLLDEGLIDTAAYEEFAEVLRDTIPDAARIAGDAMLEAFERIEAQAQRVREMASDIHEGWLRAMGRGAEADAYAKDRDQGKRLGSLVESGGAFTTVQTPMGLVQIPTQAYVELMQTIGAERTAAAHTLTLSPELAAQAAGVGTKRATDAAGSLFDGATSAQASETLGVLRGIHATLRQFYDHVARSGGGAGLAGAGAGEVLAQLLGGHASGLLRASGSVAFAGR